MACVACSPPYLFQGCGASCCCCCSKGNLMDTLRSHNEQTFLGTTQTWPSQILEPKAARPPQSSRLVFILLFVQAAVLQGGSSPEPALEEYCKARECCGLNHSTLLGSPGPGGVKFQTSVCILAALKCSEEGNGQT